MIRPEKTIREMIVILEAFGDPAAVQALRWVLGELGVEEGLPQQVEADWGLDPEHLDLSGIDRINQRLAERGSVEKPTAPSDLDSAAKQDAANKKESD